ncbi:MAG: hypothetical protein EST26_08920 [Hydrogenophaga sp.]|nr:hypothetical protein [Hydrogenophaga sp.]
MKPMPALARQRGLSLIELMISITLGLLVILAVTYVFAASRASYRHQEALSNVQESGRMALELLTRDIRMAGHPGCGNLAFLDHRTPAEFSNAMVLSGVANAAAVPDSISLTRGSAHPARLSAIAAANQIELVDAAVLGNLVAGDRLLLTDCAFTEVVQVSARLGNRVTTVAPLTRQYGPGSFVMRLERVAYSVAGNELRRSVDGAPGQAVAGNIANMKLFYGIDSSGDRSVDSYVANPANWAEVVAVRINLSVTERDVTLPFSTTVALRNRVP